MTALLEATRRLLDALPPRLLAAFLADWPTAPTHRERDAATLPVLRYLAETAGHAVPLTAPLVTLLVGSADALAWQQTYTVQEMGEAFLERYGWTELIGLRGPVRGEKIAVGFILLGPQTEYRRHRHEAEEIYVPLAGTAFWQRGETPWRRRAPGCIIHHPAWMPHAMRIEEQPLLALYLWRAGDLAQRSRLDER